MSFSAPKLIIHAPNIHMGGGLILLKMLLQAVVESEIHCQLHLDARIAHLNYSGKHVTVHYFEPSLKQRLAAEMMLRHSANTQDCVLCFNNTPPLLPVKANVFVFLHNALLLEFNRLASQFSGRMRWRLTAERFWLYLCQRHATAYIVQTPSMQQSVQRFLRNRRPVYTNPFFSSSYPRQLESAIFKSSWEFDFVYIANADPHKNHKTLVEAWCLLAEQGLRPSLCLTFEELTMPELWQWIKQQISHYDLKIHNQGLISNDAVQGLYQRSRALIFPSLIESLGLPLIEARLAGLAVLAGELDYVRDVLDPEETFNPSSAISISRAVQRFLKYPAKELQLAGAKDLLDFIIDKSSALDQK